MSLSINFGDLEDIYKEFGAYKNAMQDIRSAVTQIQRILIEENQGRWTDAMAANARELSKYVKEVEGEIDDIRAVLKGYINEMTAAIQPVNKGRPVVVGPTNIKNRISRIKSSCKLNKFAPRSTHSNRYGDGYMLDEQERANQAYNEQVLANMRKQMETCEDQIAVHIRAIERIYDNNVVPFEDTDKKYARQAKKLYNKHSSIKERTSDNLKDAGDFFGSALNSAWDTVTDLAQFSHDAIVGVIPIDNDYINEARANNQEWTEGAWNFLTHPVVGTQNMQEDAIDKIDKDGWASFAGGLLPDIILTAAGAGAVGKASKMAKGLKTGQRIKAGKSAKIVKTGKGTGGGKITTINGKTYTVKQGPKIGGSKFEIPEVNGIGSSVTSSTGNVINTQRSVRHSIVTKNPGLKGKANTSVDIVDSKGNLKTRRWYGKDGKAIRDVDITNHGNPLKHPEWPHEHNFKYNADGTLKER